MSKPVFWPQKTPPHSPSPCASLRIKNIPCPNIEVAISELKRGSTPGIDSMPLEFYLDNITEVAPLLSSLFKEALSHGELTPTMKQA